MSRAPLSVPRPLGPGAETERPRYALRDVIDPELEVVITHEPAWTPEMMAEDTKRAFGW
ncbi:MAG: hypothetical protein ABI662_03410 [Dermatophilaceae bacterium]